MKVDVNLKYIHLILGSGFHDSGLGPLKAFWEETRTESEAVSTTAH